MEKVKSKLVERLREKIGSEYNENIIEAVNDQDIHQKIKLLMKEDKIHIINEQNQPMFVKQIT